MLSLNEFNLYLIRHGQSVQNQNPDRIGQMAGTPLSDNGEVQAWRLGERLASANISLDYVFASSYKRAKDTCEIAMRHFRNPPSVEIVHDLREYSAGDWTLQSRKGVLSLETRDRMNMMTHGFLPPGGESLHQVERRASKWLEDRILYNEDIKNKAAERKANGEKPLNIFCFSHGMTIKCLLHYVMGFDTSFTWKIAIENTSISTLYFGNEGWRLLGINDHSHLLGD